VFFEGDPGVSGASAIENRWGNFAPRLGLAWDVAGDGRTSIRASVGSFYDFPHTHYMVSLTAGAPWAPRVILPDVSFDNPYASYPGGDPFPLPGGYGRRISRDVAWPLYALEAAVDYDSPNMQVTSWNLSLQRTIGENWSVEAGYLGSKLTRLGVPDVNLNQLTLDQLALGSQLTQSARR
jgi:hypothetical protein